MKKTCYIFDIDGTLADNSHRSHWVKSKPKNWPAYNKGMANDKPIPAVIGVLEKLSGYTDIIICSGREDVYQDTTREWLLRYIEDYHKLYMRKAKDYRDDCDVKRDMLREIEKDYEVLAVFDDRHKVVKMWREEGLYVFDCNQTREIF